MEKEKPRLAVLEDNADQRKLLSLILEAEYDVVMAGDGAELRRLVGSGMVDIVLIDIGLPGENGISIARQIRSESSIPLIFVSGYSSEEIITEGLTVGADDYVTKPFHNAVLLARIRNVLGRGKHRHGAPRRVQFGDVSFVVGERRLIGADGRCVKLTEMESMILDALVQSEKRTLSRDKIHGEILGNVQDKDWDSPSRSVEVHISNLRRKLIAIGSIDNPIASLRGVGYRLNLEIQPD